MKRIQVGVQILSGPFRAVYFCKVCVEQIVLRRQNCRCAFGNSFADLLRLKQNIPDSAFGQLPCAENARHASPDNADISAQIAAQLLVRRGSDSVRP